MRYDLIYLLRSLQDTIGATVKIIFWVALGVAFCDFLAIAVQTFRS